MTTAHTTAPLLFDLDDIVGLVSRNVLSYRDPEAFHVIKSDIVDQLRIF